MQRPATRGYALLVALSCVTWALSLTLFSALPQHNDNGALPIQLAEHRTRKEAARLRGIAAQNKNTKQAELAAQATSLATHPGDAVLPAAASSPGALLVAKPLKSAVPPSQASHSTAAAAQHSAPVISPQVAPERPMPAPVEASASEAPAAAAAPVALTALPPMSPAAVPPSPPAVEAAKVPTPPAVEGAFEASATAIVVLACKRVHYLKETMAGLLALKGVDRYQVFISQDGTEGGVRGYAQELTQKYPFVKYLNNDMRREQRQGDQQVASMLYISDHYKFVLTSVFERIDGINHAILIEEDMVVSPDFLTLFETTAPLLDSDPSLMCVSSWNDNGYKHMDLDSRRLLRTGFFPGLGWMLRKKLWTAELSGKWPKHPTTGWDHWMRVDEQSKGRDCIVPELSRNHNIGAQGATVSQRDFEERLGQIAFSRESGALTDFGDLSYLRADRSPLP